MAADTVVRHPERTAHRRGVATLVALVAPRQSLRAFVRGYEGSCWPRVAASVFFAATCASLPAPAADAQLIGSPAPAAPRVTNDVAGVGPGRVGAELDSDKTGICPRTEEVREAILARIDGITDCADVTNAHLAGITGELKLSSSEITSLSAGDFAGLSSVRLLNLYDNDLTTLPSGLLAGMSKLRVLYLDNNDLTALPSDLLEGVRLDELWARNNALTELPDGFFSGLPGSGFGDLQLYNNPGDPDLKHLSVCWTRSHCAEGAPIPIEFSLQALGQGRFKVVVPIGTPFELKVALDVTNGTVAGDTITIPIGRVESDTFTLTRATDATAAVTVDIVDLRATDIDPRNLRTRGGQEHVLPLWHAGFVLVKADPATTAAPEVTGSTSFTVTEGETAVATLTASDEDTPSEDLAWSLAGGADKSEFALAAGGALSFGSAKDYENPDDSGTDRTYNVTVQVSDGTNSATADVTVTLADRNEAPSADAGSDQTGIAGGATVTLSGSGSDPDADETLSYAWSQTAGTTVTLASDSSAEATFSAPSGLAANETLIFRLRVTDSGGLFADDTTDVTVLAPPPPDPDGTRAGATRLRATPRRTVHRLATGTLDRAAGDTIDYYVFTLGERQELGLGVRDQTIDLDATLEDASGDALMQSWPPPADATVEWLTTTLDTGTYYIRVEAAEDGATGYRIRLGLADPPPPTPATPEVTGSTSFTVTEGETAVATLTASDEDTPSEDLAWSLAGGADKSEFALAAGGALSFGSAKDYENPDDSGTDRTYNVTVQVSDGTNSATADVTVTLADRNEAPSADAGSDQTGIAGGATVTLSGSGSDPDADETLSYAWSQTAGTTVTLASDSSAEATFSAPSGLAANETLIFRLRVTDSGGLFAEDETDVTVLAATPSDPDGTRAGATRLTATPRRTVHRLATGTLDRAAGDTIDYYVFTLGERQELGLGVRDQKIDLDVTLEDASGDALMQSWPPPVDSTVEWLTTTLDTGTYYIRVEAAEDGATGYRIRLGLADPPPPTTAAPEVTGSTSFTVTEGETAVATLTASDEDTPSEDLAWSLAGGADKSEFALAAGGALSFGSAKDYENPDDSGTDRTYNVTVQVSDGTNSATADVTVTLADRNEAPSADAGSDQTGIAGGATVTLSGSGSDPDADETLSYAWSQTAGTTVTLASDSSAEATFSAPSGLAANETLIFRLRVTDSGGLFAEDETDVTVLAATPSDPDGTRAGATRLTATPRRTVHRLATGTLDRAAGDTIDYYVFTLGERQELGLGVRDQKIDLDVTLEDASGDALMQSWPPPVDSTVEWLTTTLDTGTYYIRVEAAEDGATGYRIRLGLADPPPPTPATPEVTGSTSFTVTEGETAVATLTASDEDTPSEDLAWSLAGGADKSEFALAAGGALSFGSAKDYENPDDSGTDRTYNVTVQVSDGTNSATADVTVTLADRNEAPSADAGSDQTGIAGGATVTLSGSGSDPDADETLSYAWSQTAGTTVTLASDSSAEATFSAPSGLAANETLIFRLRVTDSGGLFAEDETDVTVLAATPSDPDGTRAGATRLTATPRRTVHRLATGTLDRAAGDTIDYYVFTLGERQELGLGVRDQKIDLDVTLEDASGDALMQSWPPPVDSTVEWLKTTLDTGTYYIRVEAAEDGATGYRIRLGLTDPPASSSAASASDGGGDGDSGALLLLDDVTPEAAAAALFNETELGEAQLDALDRLGNRNGRYDLGDLLSWRARCRRGEARCGTPPVPAGAAILGAAAVPPAAGSAARARRRQGARRPSRRPGVRFRRAAVRLRTLILALAVWTWGCGLADDLVQPQPADAPAEPEPGRLLVRLAVPPGGVPAAGAMMLIEGPGIDSLRAHGHELIRSGQSSPTRREVIVAGELVSGPVLELWVPHVGDHALYRVRLLEVAGEDYSLRDPAEYTATISR